MQSKKSKVTDLKENAAEWQGKKGMVYYHEITFANGDKGRYGTDVNKCDFFVLGQECDYTIETRVTGKYTNTYVSPGKVADVPAYNGQRNEGKIIAQSCLHYATLYYANKDEGSRENLLSLAEEMFQFVDAHSTT